MLSVRTNVAALNARRYMTKASNDMAGNFAKLSSGYRITQASDDAAGMAVSTTLTAQIRSYHQAARNANDGLSVVQTVESALNESTNLITRLRELTVQAASDSMSLVERGYIKSEVDNIISELKRIADSGEFNGMKVLDGSTSQLQFQVGIRGTSNDVLTIKLEPVGLTGIGLDGANFQSAFISTASAGDFRSFLPTLDNAIAYISTFRASLGAAANRLTSIQDTISVASESAEATRARIRDVDVAEETAKMSANQVLVQAGVSVLAQANQTPQAALKLLGG
jgi:flagellin